MPPMMIVDPANLLVIICISSHRVAATVAQLHPEQPDRGEQVVAHKSIDCFWHELSERGQRTVVREVLSAAEASAGIEALSVFMTMSVPGVATRSAMGWAALGDEVALGPAEKALALRRVREQATGVDRELIEVWPTQWLVRDRTGEHEVDDPVGQVGSHLSCQALLISAKRGLREQLESLARDCSLDLEGVVAQPLAVYRGIAGRLKNRGSSLVIDCGARQTTVLVRRRDKLVHGEVHAFGGDDLTRRIAESLNCEPVEAEKLKREIDISSPHSSTTAHEGQQLIFADLVKDNRRTATAAKVCEDAVTDFFRSIASDLRSHGMLAQQGSVHLLGRAAQLGGMIPTVRDCFELPVVLGSGDKARQPTDELDGILTSGLVRICADRRRDLIASQSATFRKTASGLWSWLAKPIA